MIEGLQAGIDTLTDIKRAFETSNMRGRETLVDQLIRSLRNSEIPFLVGLADAIEDGLIHSASIAEL
jgi:hypothetical protein